MIITPTKLKGVHVIDTEPHTDNRGYFSRIFCVDELGKADIDFTIKQINKTLTKKKGTIRGLHFQKDPHAEDKIVYCTQGSIFDVAVDVRKTSSTYGQWHSEVLTPDNGKMLLIPKGYAHGYQTLTDDAVVEYFVSEFYAPAFESGVLWNDPDVAISWPLALSVISDKDFKLPSFNKL